MKSKWFIILLFLIYFMAPQALFAANSCFCADNAEGLNPTSVSCDAAVTCSAGQQKITCDCATSSTSACESLCNPGPPPAPEVEGPPEPEKPADTASPAGGTKFDLPNFLGVDDPNVVIGRIIKYIMGFVGTIALITFMYGGILWLISSGREAYVDKGRDTMIWSAIGLVIVFAAYVIVNTIFNLIQGV